MAGEVASLLEDNAPLIDESDIEFHGADLYGGKRQFLTIAPSERVDICRRVVDIAQSSNLIFGTCCVDKLKMLAEDQPHLLCFQFTLERVQDYLANAQDLGLIIADEHKELEQQIIRNLASSKRGTTNWGYRPTAITSVVDTVHFVKSRDNRLIQLCDVLTYFRLKGMNLSRKILAKYLVSPERSRGQNYSDYRENTLSAAEKVVWELHAKIAGNDRFSKIWPT